MWFTDVIKNFKLADISKYCSVCFPESTTME